MAGKNFDQKLFMFPDEYNRLREELFTHWNPELTGRKPHHNLLPTLKWNYWKCGWAMAWEAETFVEYMNTELAGVLKIIPTTRDDELTIKHIAGTFLKELRRIRGEKNP